LIDEDEEEDGARGECGEMPFLRRERAEEAERENGGDDGEARDDQADPAAALIEVHVFGEERGDEERDGAEFEEKVVVFPPGGEAGGAAEVQAGHQEAQGEGNGGDVTIAFAEDKELIGAVEEIERTIVPFDVVSGVVGEEEAGGENDEETENDVDEAPAREMLPEE